MTLRYICTRIKQSCPYKRRREKKVQLNIFSGTLHVGLIPVLHLANDSFDDICVAPPRLPLSTYTKVACRPFSLFPLSYTLAYYISCMKDESTEAMSGMHATAMTIFLVFFIAYVYMYVARASLFILDNVPYLFNPELET
jgi:hypothetical protein